MKKNLSNKIWLYTILIIFTGLVALYSASYQNSRVPHAIFYDQLACAIVGLIIMFILGKIDYRKYYDISYVFYIINVMLMFYVLVAGRHALGATRWIKIGPINFQPSEIAKLSVVLMLGRYFADRGKKLVFGFKSNFEQLFMNLILPFLLTAFLMLLIFKQPDLGTSLLLFGIFIVMLFVSKISMKHFIGFMLIVISFVPFGWHFLKPYQKDRLLVFLNPNIDPLGAGYTITQSKIAVGSGNIFGKGWLAGTQNQLNFLPERHTDFIFSVIGEEWGLVGALLLIFFYFKLISYCLNISEQVKDEFGTLVVIGIVSILTQQVIINIGMVIGLFPIVGLTLPFVSYGRSSFLIFIVMMGFLINLSKKRTIF